MDKVTANVRAFYETYPYPPGGAVATDGYHARLLLSYIERSHAASGRLQVLEAGCGRGLNLMAAAALQPEVDFTGIDINRVAIKQAQDRTAELGLSNLQFAEADLLDPATLPQVPGGYDLILSYGVMHHLSDPAMGLRHLRENLSPAAVVGIMVDGRFGRQPLDRYREALAIIEPDLSFDGDQKVARALAEIAEQSLFKGTYWAGTSSADEVEFADRCLHVHEDSYDIDSLNRLLNDAGMRFLRWLEPTDWSLHPFSQDGKLNKALQDCDELQRYALIERLFNRPKLTFVAAGSQCLDRSPLEQKEVAETHFRINPQLSLSESDFELSRYRLRQREIATDQPWVREILSLAKLSDSDMSGDEICRSLMQQVIDRESIQQTLLVLEKAELIYRPNSFTVIETD